MDQKTLKVVGSILFCLHDLDPDSYQNDLDPHPWSLQINSRFHCCSHKGLGVVVGAREGNGRFKKDS